MRTPRAAIVACAIAAGSGASVHAQCTPAWDTTPGNPGIGTGYVDPITLFNDGAGDAIYLGGSFEAAGGNAAIKYIARWDPASNTWSAVPGGIQPNNTTFLTSIVPADLGSGTTLFVGGAFGSAGNVADTRSIAAFRNGQWSSLGTGWPLNTADSVWSIAPWNDGTGAKLYVGGGFTTVGGVTGNGIAAWNGTSWQALGTGVTGPSNPVVFALEVFDDGSGPALYAAGRFASVNGVAGTAMIARWNGSAWTSVGGGLTTTSIAFGLEAMEVFDDGSGPALYVGGIAFNYPGQPTATVAKWNGTTWTAVGQNTTGRVTSLAVFNDGTGNALYLGGTMASVSRFAKLVNNQWVAVDGGVDASVFGLSTIGDKLYLGGSFLNVGAAQPANRFAARTSCPATSCYANCDNSTTPPTLNVADFTCFLQRFAAGESYANCDNSTTAPTLNVADFTCFLQQFAAGCP